MRQRVYQAEPIEHPYIWNIGFIKHDRSQIAGYTSHDPQAEIVLGPLTFIHDSLARRLCLNSSREATEGLTRKTALELFQYELWLTKPTKPTIVGKSLFVVLEHLQNQAFRRLKLYGVQILMVSCGFEKLKSSYWEMFSRTWFSHLNDRR